MYGVLFKIHTFLSLKNAIGYPQFAKFCFFRIVLNRAKVSLY